jgi:hypothetical protein
VTAGGEIRVALLRPDGSPIPGRATSDCTPITGDSRKAPVTWTTGSDLPAEEGVIVDFELRQADLFGLQFLPD